MELKFSLPAYEFASKVSSSLINSLFVTYACYCLQLDGPVFFPRLGTMWNYEICNFISRRTLIGGSIFLSLTGYIIYLANKTNGPELLKNHRYLNEFLLIIFLLACFCLSLMGAVCSDEYSPECLGNAEINSVATLSFFFLCNAYMVIAMILQHKDRHKMKTYKRLKFWIMVTGSTLCKARFLVPSDTELTEPLGPWFALAEWVDYILIMLFTASYVAHIAGDYSVAIGTDTDLSSSSMTTVWNLNGRTAARFVVYHGLSTLLLCLFTAVLLHNVDYRRIPSISDTFVYPPGNYLSRWGGVMGAAYLQLLNFLLLPNYKETTSNTISILLFLLSYTSATALSFVMVVSENEFLFIHALTASTFFICYDIFIVLFLVFVKYRKVDCQEIKKDTISFTIMKVILCIIIVIAMSAILMYFVTKLKLLLESELAIIEWLNAAGILFFIATIHKWYGYELKTTSASILYTKSAEITTLEKPLLSSSPDIHTESFSETK